MKTPLILAAVAVLALSACEKGQKPGDAQPVPKAETSVPISAPTPTTVSAVGTPSTAADR